jgi:hypothetical protein
LEPTLTAWSSTGPSAIEVAHRDGELVRDLVAVDARRRFAGLVVAIARLHGELRRLHVALRDPLVLQRRHDRPHGLVVVVEGGARRGGLADDPDAHHGEVRPRPDLADPDQRQAARRLGLLRGGRHARPARGRASGRQGSKCACAKDPSLEEAGTIAADCGRHAAAFGAAPASAIGSPWARSSTGQSRRLITAWLQVRVLPGPP